MIKKGSSNQVIKVYLGEQYIEKVILNSSNIHFIPSLYYQYMSRVVASGGTIEDATALLAFIRTLSADPVMSQASLAMSPSGKKAGKLFSILPEDGSGDFTVVRASNTAVRKNAQGFYEPVPANMPRFDYDVATGKLSVNGEPAATNLIIDPRLFSKPSWNKTGAIIKGDPTTAGAEILTNCGAAGQTDWVDSNSDGVADNVLMGSGADLSTGSIVTGNGFTGNAQRCVENNAVDRAFVRIEANIVANKRYLLQFKYRCNSALGSGTSSFIYSVPVNTGDAVSYELYFGANGNSSYLSFYTGILAGAYIELDEVSLKEVQGFACPFVDSNGVNTLEGMKLVATANNATIKLTTPVTTTPATSYVSSLFIKRVTGTGQVYLVDINNTDRAITLTTDWQRFEYAAAAAGATGQAGVKLATSGDEVMICHQQTAVGTVATSPIYAAIEGSSETRNADNISLTGASALIGQTEGTVIMDLNIQNLNIIRVFFALQETSWTTESIRLESTAANLLRFFIRSGSATITDISSVVAISAGRNKIAAAYKTGTNEIVVYMNGEKIIETTTTIIPTLDGLVLGARSTNIGVTNEFPLNDSINSILKVKTRLSNAQLAALTTL